MRLVIVFILSSIALFGQADKASIGLDVANPSPVTNVGVAQSGTPGTTTYYYQVVANFPIGSSISQPVQITNANATLSGSNFNVISWTPQPYATSYDIVRSTTGQISFPCTACLVSSGVTTNSVNDQSNTVTSYTYNAATTASASIRLNNRDFSTPRLEWYVGSTLIGSKLFGPLPQSSGGNGATSEAGTANQICEAIVNNALITSFCNSTLMPATPSAVNQVTIKDAGVGVGPTLVATGSDSAIPLNLSSKGSGAINFLSENSGVSLLSLLDTASGINFPTVTPGAAGNPFTVGVGTTTDAVVDQVYSCKGTGCAVRIPNAVYSNAQNVTVANINAGFNLVPAVAGHTLRIVHFYLAARGGAAATCTDIRLGDSNNANAIVIDPIVNLTQNTGNTEGTSTIAQSGFGATAFTAGLGINIFKTGGNCATMTSADVEVQYTIN